MQVFAKILRRILRMILRIIFRMILRKMISFCKDFEENVIVFLFAKILRMVLREFFCKDFEENASRQP